MAVDQCELTSWPVHPANFSLYLAGSLSIAIGLPSEGNWTEVSVRTGTNNNGRDDWIRTSGLTHPKGARYQAALRPDRVKMGEKERITRLRGGSRRRGVRREAR